MKDRVKKFFDRNKAVDVLHSTSDGFLFTEKQYAKVHSLTLEDKYVGEWNRNENKSEQDIEPLSDSEKKQVNNKKSKKDGTTKGNVQNTK